MTFLLHVLMFDSCFLKYSCSTKDREERYADVKQGWTSGHSNWHRPAQSTPMKLWFSESAAKRMGGWAGDWETDRKAERWRTERKRRKSGRVSAFLSDWATEIRGAALRRFLFSISLFISASLTFHHKLPNCWHDYYIHRKKRFNLCFHIQHFASSELGWLCYPESQIPSKVHMKLWDRNVWEPW